MNFWLLVIIIGVLWVICGVLAYGLTLAYFQREYNSYGLARESRRRDVIITVVGALFGPAALASALICGFTNHGFLWRPLPDDQINDGY